MTRPAKSGLSKHYVSSYWKRRYGSWEVKEEVRETDSLFLGRLKLGLWGVYSIFLRQPFLPLNDWLVRAKLHIIPNNRKWVTEDVIKELHPLYFFQLPFNRKSVSVSTPTHAGADIWILTTSSVKNFIFYFGI